MPISMLGQIRADQERFAVIDRAATSLSEQAFFTALANHCGATYREVEQAYDRLNPNLRSNIHSAAGWTLLSKALLHDGTPLLVPTIH